MQRLPRPCIVPTCPNEAANNRAGKCSDHWIPPKKTSKQKKKARYYMSKRQRDWRARVLARDRYCVDPIGRHPEIRKLATQADHILPLSAGGDYSLSNGRGLCAACHGVVSRRWGYGHLTA